MSHQKAPIRNRRWLPWLNIALVLTVPALADDGPKSDGGQDIVATKKGKVYHAYRCTFARKIRPANLIHFRSKEEAEQSGRRLCSYCAHLAEKAEKQRTDPPTMRGASGTSNGRKAGPKPKPSSPPPEVAVAGGVELRVKMVLPGGTLISDSGEKIRLLGVMWPERGQSSVEEAVRFIERRLRRRTVRVQFAEDEAHHPRRDSLGRTLAYIVVEPGKRDLGGELLTSGFGWIDTDTHFDRLAAYRDMEDTAAWAERGIWATLPGPAGKQKVVIGKYAPHYHAPDCPHVPHLTDSKTVTLNQAKSRRLTPCEFYRDDSGRKPQ
ncbi:MAG: thermonuclease family protein [Phycisphaerae bacterium]